MKRLLLNAIIITMLLSCFSCEDDISKSETHSAIQLKGLKLNNNEKWIANKETHIGMKRIDWILKNNIFSDGKIVGEALSKQISYIIESCDMTGEAHDQLHLVLVPILEETTSLKDEENAKEVEKKAVYLQRLTATYFKYFKKLI